MKVMGIDPGVAKTGYAVVEGSSGRLVARAVGVVRTPPGLAQEQRLLRLCRELRAVLAEHRPDAAAIERVFFNANVRTAMSVGQGAGVALLAAAERAVPVACYTPTEVKMSVVGVGSADKNQIQQMVAALLRLPAPPSPADAADACALAICHLHRGGLSKAVGDPAAGRRAARRLAEAVRAQGGGR